LTQPFMYSLYFLHLSPLSFCFILPPPPISPLFPYTTLFRSPLYSAPCATQRLSKSFSASDNLRLDFSGGIWSSSAASWRRTTTRSEEHTSELQSRRDLVCRLLLEKKKKTI